MKYAARFGVVGSVTSFTPVMVSLSSTVVLAAGWSEGAADCPPEGAEGAGVEGVGVEGAGVGVESGVAGVVEPGVVGVVESGVVGVVGVVVESGVVVEPGVVGVVVESGVVGVVGVVEGSAGVLSCAAGVEAGAVESAAVVLGV